MCSHPAALSTGKTSSLPHPQFIGGSIIGLNKKAPGHWPNLSISNVLLDIRKKAFTEGVFKYWNAQAASDLKLWGCGTWEHGSAMAVLGEHLDSILGAFPALLIL